MVHTQPEFTRVNGELYFSCDNGIHGKELCILRPTLPCEGDFDGNGEVDDFDIAVFAENFGRADCDMGDPCEGDFNDDNTVDGDV